MSTFAKSEELTVRSARLDEMPFFLALAEKEGWNPGLEDAASFYAADPQGFLIGERKGEKVGCISAVKYGAHFGFLGFYIVKPPHRHQGFGLQLWQKAMAYMGQRCVGLDGVVEQQSNYKKSGFKLFCKNARFVAEGEDGAWSDALVDMKRVPLKTVMDYDCAVFGASREAFLSHWLRMSNAHCLGLFDRQQLKGYGVLRACVKGYKVGPLFADHPAIALEIFQGLRRCAGNQVLFLDVPEINLSALELASRFKMKKVFETARMYTTEPPSQQMQKAYGVTSFELG